MSPKALEGVRVVDLGWVLASPLTTKILADYGATVICVESTKRPDLTRTGTPYKDEIPGVNRAGNFAFHAANKYSISLDMRKPGGMDIARKLIHWTDVVCENRRPGTLKKMGLDYIEMRKINPDIILLSSSNQGQTGPFATHPGLGTNLNGLAGFNNLIGWPDQEALTLMVAFTDYLTPPLAVANIIACLDRRQRTGEGCFLDLSQLEVGLNFLSPLLLNYSINNVEPRKMGNSSNCAAPHGIYKCKGEDRWCAIAVFDDTEWERFCIAIDHREWLKEPKLSTLKNRKANENELNNLIEEATVQYTAEQLMLLMQKSGIAAGVVKNSKDLSEDPQLRARDFFWVMEHPELGEFTHLGEPAILSKTPAKPCMPAPCLGEHTEYICKELLGMTEDEFTNHVASDTFGF